MSDGGGPPAALPVALSDASAVPFGTGIALVGGRTADGRVPTITLLTTR